MIETKKEKQWRFIFIGVSILIVVLAFRFQQLTSSEIPKQEWVAENSAYIYFVQSMKKGEITHISLYQVDKNHQYKTVLFDQIEESSDIKEIYIDAYFQETFIKTSESYFAVSEKGIKKVKAPNSKKKATKRIPFSVENNRKLYIKESNLSYELPQSSKVLDIIKGNEIYLIFTETDWIILER
ncbi:hypothetical protein [Mangrovibacillus cuniculi]|uniref:Uncharacterized protein n=1 Tax=Mangrovibacillus cuniculi TaxID=2593652 RepID=A0A7S8CCC2_9BACI|nr:hypothetical protein [Mangrovibacillus cuniculi]QPC47246.1 hypothetical protein G8O30_09810 [Mangrovibacillus cuniculi]